MSEDYSGYGVSLEPTPLSDVIHCQHIMHQQQQKLLLLQVQQRGCAEIDYLANRVMKRKRGERLRVGFSSQVMEFHNPRDLEEIETSWYSKDERAVFKEERKTIIRALKKVNFDLSRIDQTVYQLRGLEAYLSLSFNKLMLRKRTEVIKSVMAEQARQRSQGIRDSEALRDVSCGPTEWASGKGLELGHKDAQDAGNSSFPLTAGSLASWGHDSDTPSLCRSTSASSSSSSESSARSMAESVLIQTSVNGLPNRFRTSSKFY
jgi:hypothetical protein